ncbi:MAG TPA: baseplate J/gp47 family protein [Candidatus Limnocylindrales bacterium]|nr:baseplate J/gp47 family protein [Candidatus Limnocylindrales bacterium]
MATIVYLDADDEITSAAARIRAADDARVGIVLPFGSRVATSRINFRLLAREALATGRRLDIVAPDAAARALAASAGLAVFASVGEYEAALDAADAADDPTTDLRAAGLGTGVAAAGAAPVPTRDGRPIDPSRDTAPTQRVRVPITEPASDDYGAPGVAGAAAASAATPVVAGRGVRTERDHRERRGVSGRAILVGVVALVLVGAGAVAAVTVVPSADITVTPRIEPLGPISFTVRADPAATVVDPEAGVIPATTVQVPVTVSGEFPATGKKVVREKAKGSVRFTNCDPSSSYTIPAGSVVSTRDGTGFELDEAVFLAVAGISGSPPNIRVRCTSNDVGVTAAKSGPDGNVDAGAIRVVPARYNRNLVRVTNPRATSGGSREEFPQVTQADVDGAVAKLNEDALGQFQAGLADPSSLPEGTTVFPETAAIGQLTPDVDPKTLVDQEVESFTLSLSGSGTAQAVDASPIEAIAAQRLADAVPEGYELVEGSTAVDVGDGTVVGGVISFPVDATARQVRPVDAATLEPLVLGLPKADAEEALAEYGAVSIVLWPGYVTSVPTLGQRVNVVVAAPVDPNAGATPTPKPTPRETPLEEPPSDAESGEPLPSG